MTKSIFKIFGLIFILVLCFQTDMDAQSRKKKKKKKEDTETQINFADRLWYGGGFNVGFSGYDIDYNLRGNIFQIGLSPMVGYKVLDFLSIGPRAEIVYTGGRFRFNGQGDVFKLNSWSYAVGPFVRAKTPFNLFAHIEYSYINEDYLTGQVTIDKKVQTGRLSRDAFYIGAGYFSNNPGSFGYEMYLTYDLLAPENTTNLPLNIRFGVNYNF